MGGGDVAVGGQRCTCCKEVQSKLFNCIVAVPQKYCYFKLRTFRDLTYVDIVLQHAYDSSRSAQ